MMYPYAGLIRCAVHNEDGSLIANAEDYFYEMDTNMMEYVLRISESMQNHLIQYLPPKEERKNVWQCGFGGDECDGLIDFALQSKPPVIPGMKFEVFNTNYIMKFGNPKFE